MKLNNIYNSDIYDYNSNDNKDDEISSENIESLKKQLDKLKIKLKAEEDRVKDRENTIKKYIELKKEKEEKFLSISKQYNEKGIEMRMKYQINEEDIFNERNQKDNQYTQNINDLKEKIKNLEFENMKLNQQINEYKDKNNQIEIELSINEDNLKDKISELEDLQEFFDSLKQEIINKEEAFESKINELNLKILQLKEINNNKQEFIKNKINTIKSEQNNIKKDNNSVYLYKSANNFYLKNKNIFKSLEKYGNINNINYLRERIKKLQEKALQMTKYLSLKYEENEELNKEKKNLESERLKIKNKKENKYGKENEKNNNVINKEENKIKKIIELKTMINNYKNAFANIKSNLYNISIEHKLKINEIMISYENKVNKLIQKLNNLKTEKSDDFQICEDIFNNFFDDN
jgi:hypothetical protein